MKKYETEETKVEENVDEQKPVVGIVEDCIKLNLRKEASLEADVLTEVLSGSTLLINEEESTDEFYKVCTASGLEGYCMKTFVNIKE